MARILIIDDSALTRRVLRQVLMDDHEVSEEVSGEAALVRLETETFDCLLVDLLMPTMDGFAVLAALAKRGITIPAIVLTADGQTTTREKCLQLGAAEVITKPALYDQDRSLRDTIARVLSASTSQEPQ